MPPAENPFVGREVIIIAENGISEASGTLNGEYTHLNLPKDKIGKIIEYYDPRPMPEGLNAQYHNAFRQIYGNKQIIVEFSINDKTFITELFAPGETINWMFVAQSGGYRKQRRRTTDKKTRKHRHRKSKKTRKH